MYTGPKHNIYIIGAGLAGISIAGEIRKKEIFGKILAFLDDNPVKIGKKIDGIPILGPIEDIVEVIHTSPEDEALIAIPSGTKEQLLKIYHLLQKANFSRIRILPRISQILDGDAHLIQARAINPEDLLTRKPVRVNLRESLRYVRGKRVLISGAGGSIGSELARQLLSGGASRLFLFGHGENSIYEIQKELKILQEGGVGEKATIVPVIGELQDREYMRFILERLQADIIYHTAAHKHVPLMEQNPVEAVKNNVFGTRNLLEGACRSGVSKFVLISTDKAVEPSSVYGASKYLAEELVRHCNFQGKTQPIIVRFGNVLGSRGSILPLFRDQILKGGPVTITDARTSRYYMTIPEATSLVLKAASSPGNRQTFVLDMGDPIFTKDLAEQLIHFYGYTPDNEIQFEYTGLRPGEKMTEKLWSGTEIPESTDITKVMTLNNTKLPDFNLEMLLDNLYPVCYFIRGKEKLYRNRHRLKELLKTALPEFKIPDDEPEY